MGNGRNYSEAYYRKSKWIRTWSRIPVEEVYTPQNTNARDYSRELNDPGEYPYTRGIYPDMYRGRLWTVRQISAHSSAEESNRRVQFLFDAGEGGINVIADIPTQIWLDSDHPMAEASVGVQGAPLCTLLDMEALMEGLPIEQVSTTFSTLCPVTLAQYLVVAEKSRIPPDKIRGTTIMDIVHGRFCGYGEEAYPHDLAIRLTCDTIEYAARHLPLWNPVGIECYDLREWGITAVQELAFGFSLAFGYIDELLRRGLDIDDVACKICFTMSAHIDIFEEAAKFRAARRLWARTLKEKYGAKDPKSLKFKFHTNTAGSMMTRQQPLNNIVRAAYGSLAAVLGGTQSLNTTPYDEAISIPTEHSHRTATMTQHILAFETGVANVADPLAGSYYVEHLTDRIEEEVCELLKKIDAVGGGFEAVRTGWIRNEAEKAAYQYQKEVESGERLVVGSNAFQIPEEEEEEPAAHQIVAQAVDKHLARLRRLRETRDQVDLKRAINNLYCKAHDSRENLIGPIIEAVKAYATVGEIMGTIRVATGYDYDARDVLRSPFDFEG